MNVFTSRVKIIAGIVIVLMVVFAGWDLRRSGIAIGRISERVVETRKRVDELEPVVKAAAKASDVEVGKSIAKRPEYRAARAKLEVKGDTVVSDGQTVVLPSVAGFVKVADSRAAQDSTTIAKKAAQDTVNLALFAAYNAHDAALEQEKRPRFGMKTGVAIGVVGTATVLIIAVKIIRAVAHR